MLVTVRNGVLVGESGAGVRDVLPISINRATAAARDIGGLHQGWREFIRPIVKCGTFRMRYLMRYSEVRQLYGMLRMRPEGNELRWKHKNGTDAGEWAFG